MLKGVIAALAFGFLLVIASPGLCDAVAIWTFDEGEGDTVEDSSGNGNDGEITGTSLWIGGMFGKALYFDMGVTGVDYITVPDSVPGTMKAGINSRPQATPRSELLFHTLKNKHVSVYRHTDGKNKTAQSRQGKGNRYQLEQRQHQRPVEYQRHTGENPRQTVVNYHKEHHRN